ncbi:F-box/kelch-repeat protein At3g18720-like [Solanum verrucosum]|uniref:F-box/kelch-repeat protein At3g18720-like n=1 Tax=Solanum verrucosum TaxID=315347 RepID=UPI0020D1C07C|nr:F-box/kelch-repeat protein At3g18720-like [Solanum verrucosum]
MSAAGRFLIKDDKNVLIAVAQEIVPILVHLLDFNSSPETNEINIIAIAKGWEMGLDLVGGGAGVDDSLLQLLHVYLKKKTRSISQRAVITTLYMPFTLANKACQPLNNFVSRRPKIQHNTSTNTRSDKLKKRPSRINSKRPPVDSNICIHLSRDLQREISRHLISQEAYMNFRLVCKLWRSVAPPLRWKVVVDDDDAAPSYHQDSMWLLSLNQNDGLCTFYNPFRNFNGYMSNNDLVGCEIRYAKDGWLLVSKGKSLFLLEPSPSGKQIIHLPQKTDEYFCDIMSFSASPTNSSAWVIFGIAFLNLFQVRISYLRQGNDKWTTITRDSEVPFILSSSSPVYFGEEFCVISQYGGNVGVFGFLKDGTPYWVIHQLSELYSPPIPISNACRLFLVQQDQNVLHSVVVTPQHDVHVYELDFGGNVIVKLVKEVKNWLFFTSEASSMAVCGMNVNVDNAVFLPTFNTCNDYTYYSLEDVTFKVLKDNCTDKTQQKELLNRVWIRCELTEN